MGLPLNTPNKKFFLSLLPLTSYIKGLEHGQGGRWVSSSSSYSNGSSQVPIGGLIWSEFCRLWLIIRVLPRNYKALHERERIVEKRIWDFERSELKVRHWTCDSCEIYISFVPLENYCLTVLVSHSREWGPFFCFLFFVSLPVGFSISFPGQELSVSMYRHMG